MHFLIPWNLEDLEGVPKFPTTSCLCQEQNYVAILCFSRCHLVEGKTWEQFYVVFIKTFLSDGYIVNYCRDMLGLRNY